MDLGIAFDPASMSGDIAFDGINLVLDATPASRILVALGTDRRALISDRLPDAYSSTNPQGPMAGRRGSAVDALDPLGRRIGSRLWLLAREKLDEAVRKRAEGIVAEALAGLDTQLGTDLLYQVTIPAPGVLGIAVQAGPRRTNFVMPIGALGPLAPPTSPPGAPIVLDARPSAATYLDAVGDLVEVGPNILRPLYVGGVQDGYLVEGAAANVVRNPRCEGAVVGSPGAFPTYWGVGVAPGLAWQIVGTGTEAGVPYVDIKASGTITSSGVTLALNAYMDVAGTVLTSASTWTLSVWAQVIAGATPNGQLELHFEEDGSGSVFPGTVIANPSTWSRYSETVTMNYPTDTSFLGELWVYGSGGDVVDFTVRIGAPQIEEGPAATSLILPPAGSPGISTRAADTIWAPGADAAADP